MKFFKIVNKKLFTLFMIGIFISFLIVFAIVAGMLHYVHSPKGSTVTTTSSVSDASSESASGKDESGTTGSGSTTKKDTEPITLEVTKQGDQYIVMDSDNGGPDYLVTGVAWATIDGVKDLYYFYGGIYDPTYTGDAMLFNSTMGGTGEEYYVTNGHATKK